MGMIMGMAKFRVGIVAVAAAGALAGGLGVGGPGAARAAAPAPAEAAAAPTRGDLTGDGKADLAVYGGWYGGGQEVQLVPGGTVGRLGRGAVAVNQNDPGIPLGNDPAAFEEFGTVLAYGDFNRDGRTDLAVGAPEASVGGVTSAGAVTVLYGRAGTPYYARARLFTQNTPGVPGVAERSDRFADALAAGDFDGDGYADLAVGTPREDLGSKADAGSVTILRGGTGGLTATGAKLLTQDTRGIPGTADPMARFGLRLAAGNLAGGRADELVVVAPNDGPPAGTPEFICAGPAGTTQRSRPSGSVTVLRGGTSGPLTSSGVQYLTAAKLALGGITGGVSSFSNTAVTGRLYGGTYADLAVSGRQANGGKCGEGAVAVVRGGKEGLPATATTVLTAAGVGRPRVHGALFGDDLAVGDVDANGTDDLLAISRRINDGSDDHRVPGYAGLMFGSTRGPATAGHFTWEATQDTDGDQLVSGALLDVDGDGTAELALAAPVATTESDRSTGILYVLKVKRAGTSAGITAWQRVRRGSLGTAGHNGPVGPLAR
ncbi:FG-GAP repeat protein [Streptomyces sp. NPDC086023]|uniref:FG-GAP repeat protein n=1 Tax=Streptomyces sp. NPDC086023 TaxID=3365746 RepID=UPI0037D2B089